MTEDQAAFETVTAIRKLPETDPSRAARFNAALLACIRVPEAMAATAVAILEIVDRITNFVNPHLLSDLAVCADLAMATARCAVLQRPRQCPRRQRRRRPRLDREHDPKPHDSRRLPDPARRPAHLERHEQSVS